jgi:hypothetical protein
MLMTNPRPCFAAATTLLVGWLAVVPTIGAAAALPVKIDGFEGEVVQVVGTIHSGVTPGKALQPGTQLKTGADGRADVSLNGAPTLRLGNGVDLLLHSMDQDVLRLRSASGAIFVDARTPVTPGGKSRDVRLNAGDLRLRVANAEAWVEVDDRSGQVCVMAGVVEVQQPNAGAVRLDTPGQCLRQSGLSSQWTMVPIDLLQARIAATGVQRVAVAATPEAPTPKPVLQIKVLPLPGTLPDIDRPKEQIVVLQQTPTTSSVEVKVPEAVDVPEVPPVPEPMPVAPAAASTVALKLAAPVEVPLVPDPPEPLPIAPAPATAVAMKAVEPVEVPVVPDPPEPMPVAPAPAPAVAMTLAEPVESPEVPPAPAAPSPVAPAVVAAPGRPKPVPLPPETADSAPAAVEPVAPKPVPADAAAPIVSTPPAPAGASDSTELALAAPASAPGADDGRRWRVVLGSMPEKEKAEMEAERLNARGWAVEAREYRVGDRRGFRIGFGDFLARQDAQKALEEFLVQYPDAPAWLAKY